MSRVTIPLDILSDLKEPTTLRFFFWCLVQATPAEITLTVRGQTLILLPGQFVFNRRRATTELEDFGLTERKIRTALSRCVASQKVSQKTSQKITVITVENFGIYEVTTSASVPKNVPKNVPELKNKNRQRSESPVVSNARNTRNTKDKHPALIEAITQVFHHYRKTFPTFGRTVRPGHKDWNLIGDRIKDGYSVDDCISAINGNSVDDWFKAKSFHSIKYIFRDTEKMDRFILTWQNYHRPVISDKTQRGIRAATAFVNRQEETHGTERQG
jgi:hypothetical protein|tara:strand:- start:423 stop:1238 length:816 start_codon:yes stop_codon:yes gene_type:complete